MVDARTECGRDEGAEGALGEILRGREGRRRCGDGNALGRGEGRGARAGAPAYELAHDEERLLLWQLD